MTGPTDPFVGNHGDAPVDALVDALTDLGRHLDVHPPPEERATPSLATRVLDRIDDLDRIGALYRIDGSASPAVGTTPADGSAPPHGSRNGVVLKTGRWRSRPSRALGVAAALVVLVTVVLAIEPTRDAVAGWFGIGAVRLEQVDRLVTPDPLPSPDIGSLASTPGSRPESPGAGGDGAGTDAGGDTGNIVAQLAAAEDQLTFPIHLPDKSLTGAPQRVTVDPAVTIGLVEITYSDFTLVEVASRPGELPPLTKLMPPGATVRYVSVGAYPALWISGTPHELAYIRPDGSFATDTIRRAGNVLLWEAAGVTHRLEGLLSLERAQSIAATMP